VGISDLDEIPSKSAIELAKTMLKTHVEAVCLEQEMFYFNFRQIDPVGWIPGALATNRYVKRASPQGVRNAAMWNILPHVANGGWHLSCWGSPEEISYKISNFAHQELNVPEFTNVENIQRRISSGGDPYDKRTLIPVDPLSLPKLPREVFRIFNKDEGQRIPHFYQNIEGWFGPDDILFYKETFDRSPSTAHFVEIGSFKGRRSAFMATEIANGRKNIKFDCVDTWDGSPEHQIGQPFEDQDSINNRMFDVFNNNMSPVNGFYNTKRMTSTAAAMTYPDDGLDFVFIDADHSYESVIQDIVVWSPKVRTGGILSGHDYHHEPVRRAVHQLLTNVQTTGNCWWIVKQ